MTNAQVLWHASDDPSIEIFHPRHAPTSNIDGEFVWAVDDEHVPAYWFPRDCPRATFWIGPTTSADDVAWMNGAKRVHAIEWTWWERVRDAHVFLYLMPPETFRFHAPEAGYFVSDVTVIPLARIELDDLVRTHAEAGIELRLLHELWPLWDRVTSSTLQFSGIRLSNARPRVATT